MPFRVADLIYHKMEVSATSIDELMELWAMSKAGDEDDLPPFDLYSHLYSTINATTHRDAPWKSFIATVEEDIDANLPSWKHAQYQVWYHDPDLVLRNMLDNPEFKDQFDYVPYVEMLKDGKPKWTDFMSGNYAWRHSVCKLIYLCEDS